MLNILSCLLVVQLHRWLFKPSLPAFPVRTFSPAALSCTEPSLSGPGTACSPLSATASAPADRLSCEQNQTNNVQSKVLALLIMYSKFAGLLGDKNHWITWKGFLVITIGFFIFQKQKCLVSLRTFTGITLHVLFRAHGKKMPFPSSWP